MSIKLRLQNNRALIIQNTLSVSNDLNQYATLLLLSNNLLGNPVAKVEREADIELF